MTWSKAVHWLAPEDGVDGFLAQAQAGQELGVAGQQQCAQLGRGVGDSSTNVVIAVVVVVVNTIAVVVANFVNIGIVDSDQRRHK